MRRIRKLTDAPKDFKNVVDFVVQNFVPEHDMGVLSASNLNLEKGMKWVLFNIREAVFIVEDDGKLIGTIGLNKTSPWYSDAEYLTDGWFYVLPQYRKKGVAGILIEAAKDYAKEKSLPLIVGVFSKEDALGKAGIMNKLGLITVGGLFATGV